MVLGLEKISELEKLVQSLREKVEDLSAEVGVLRTEVKELADKAERLQRKK